MTGLLLLNAASVVLSVSGTATVAAILWPLRPNRKSES